MRKSAAPARSIRTSLWPLFLLPWQNALAHHSASMYDDHQSVTVVGTVSHYVWANPHVYIYVVQQQGGRQVEWELEGSPPSILRRLGWSPSTLKRGDAITVVGRPAKNPMRKALLPISIKLGNTMLFDRKTEVAQLSTAKRAAVGPVRGINGVWVTVFAKEVDDQLDADHMTLTRAGREAYKHFDEKRNPAARCVAYTAPVFMITPDLKRVSQSGDVVVIESEFDAAQRTVYLDQTSHGGIPSSLQGHSIRHWEGKSLVIDTARFSVNLVGDSYGLPSGTQKHLVERLTPSADGTKLSYHFELSDPEYMAKPVSGDVTWLFRPDAVYAPARCNLDIARRYTEE